PTRGAGRSPLSFARERRPSGSGGRARLTDAAAADVDASVGHAARVVMLDAAVALHAVGRDVARDRTVVAAHARGDGVARHRIIAGPDVVEAAEHAAFLAARRARRAAGDRPLLVVGEAA